MSNEASVLLTDYYQLTMAQAYFELDMHAPAVFELFVRRLPPTRRFLVTAGLQQAIEFLEQLRFHPDELDFLSGLKIFSSRFLDYLAALRFSGSVHAMPEGTPFFADEPIVRVTAPLPQAQLVESRLLNLLHFQTLVASKAARCGWAARGRRLIDFGMRRAHGAEAALFAARAAFIAGFDATATVEAGRRFGIPLSGTMAHSFIEAHDHEENAFQHYTQLNPGGTTLLIDTYDTKRAARYIVGLASRLGPRAGHIRAVRIDSGDLAAQARAVRAIFDAADRHDIGIVLSGSLDEHRIDALLQEGVPVDAFGIGTRLDVSEDAPSLDMAYKLEEYAGRARRKRSPGKATWPGAKQVFRERDATAFTRDRVALATETFPGEPLLHEVMCAGRRTGELPALNSLRTHCIEQLALLPTELRSISAGPCDYPVEVSADVRNLARELRDFE